MWKQLIVVLLLFSMLAGCTSNPSPDIDTDDPTLDTPKADVPAVNIPKADIPEIDDPAKSEQETHTPAADDPVISDPVIQPPEIIDPSITEPMDDSTWFYYRVDYDGDIYRKRGGERQAVPSEYGEIIYGDDFIYFTNRYGLFAMDDSGTTKCLWEGDEYSMHFIADGGDIIYFTSDQGIYRINKSGEELEKLAEDDSRDICVTDNYLFFTVYINIGEEWNDEGPPMAYRLYRLDLNDKSVLDLEFFVTDLNAYEESIYYSKYPEYEYHRADPESLDSEVIFSDNFIERPLFADGQVFFENNRTLKKMDLNSLEVHQIADGWPTLSSIFSGYVYFLGYSEDGMYRFNRVKTDGTNIEYLR